jgi:hypothetical protein
LSPLSLLGILNEVNKDSLCAHDIHPSVRLSVTYNQRLQCSPDIIKFVQI